MSRSPTRHLRTLRRLTLLAVLAGVLYLILRFDVLTLPGTCSPVRALPAGARLVVDRWPSVCEAGDLVFYGPEEGPYEFGRVEARSGEHASVGTDNEACVGPRGMGPHTIDVADVRGRVVFVVPR